MPNVHNHVRGFTCNLYDGDECKDRPPRLPISLDEVFKKMECGIIEVHEPLLKVFKTREKRDDK